MISKYYSKVNKKILNFIKKVKDDNKMNYMKIFNIIKNITIYITTYKQNIIKQNIINNNYLN